MKNLEQQLASVWSATDLEEKRAAARKLIDESHAKALTKSRAILDLEAMTGPKIDQFMTNYMLSGEGLAVAR